MNQLPDAPKPRKWHGHKRPNDGAPVTFISLDGDESAVMQFFYAAGPDGKGTVVRHEAIRVTEAQARTMLRAGEGYCNTTIDTELCAVMLTKFWESEIFSLEHRS